MSRSAQSEQGVGGSAPDRGAPTTHAAPPAWFGRLSALADRPEDDGEDRLRHRFLMATGLAMSAGGVRCDTGFSIRKSSVVDRDR